MLIMFLSVLRYVFLMLTLASIYSVCSYGNEITMTRRKCRLWWPEQFLSCTSSSNLFLFGWFMDSVNSLDIVVAAAIPSLNLSVHLLQTNLEEILRSVNGNMPVGFRESSTFSMLGYYTADYPDRKLKPVGNQNDENPSKTKDHLHCLGVKDSPVKANICDIVKKQCNQESDLEATSSDIYKRWNCGCKELVEPHRQSLMSCDYWILLFCKPRRILYKNKQIPCLHHIHHNGDVLSPVDVHIIIYEPPTYGVSHLSLSYWRSPECVGLPLKKPNWVNELHKKPLLLDLNRVLMALNCANAAKILLEQRKGISGPISHFFMSILLRLASIVWHMVAALVASISTVVYIFLQLFNKLLSFRPRTLSFVLPKMFKHTWENVHIRSCQFLYWPIFLQDTGVSSKPNVEYAHKAALRKHFIWSNVLMDVLFGTVLGVLLLTNVEAICTWVLVTVGLLTNDLLRSGCVWLMGVPAGFKLNNELAELVGMISLNAIQIFSTLWFFLGAFLRLYIQVLAVLGIVFGSTVPVALCIDMLKLVTLHVYALHYLISFLYSQQIQALASLWRLFRSFAYFVLLLSFLNLYCPSLSDGRKRNPLRQRLDSYDYTVEQHVVGSLLFTPLLLLIPTTSVFYIFFTSLITAILSLCITFEIIISLVHATPYAEILLWIISRRRFPSGIWFRIKYANYEMSVEACSPTYLDIRNKDFFVGGSESLVSVLCSNYATIGQVIRHYYSDIFSEVSPSFCTSLACGMLSGQRFPSTLGTRMPSTMPWMQITWREYWKLSYTAVLSSRL
ncbi:unnamed protein product [Musa banksii]